MPSLKLFPYFLLDLAITLSFTVLSPQGWHLVRSGYKSHIILIEAKAILSSMCNPYILFEWASNSGTIFCYGSHKHVDTFF